MASHSETDLSLASVASAATASSSTFSIRRALPEDNDKLIDLARRCPMKGQLEMYTDRYPDFFATNRVQGEVAHIFLAETPEGQVVGCGAFTEKTEKRGDKTINVLHIGDVRADPSLRRGRVAAKLIEIYLEMLRTGPYDHGIVEILGGNAAGRNLNSLLTEEFVLQDEGRMLFYQLVPFRSYRLPGTWTYRQAAESDLPAIVALFDLCYGDAPGAPHFTVDWLQKELARDPSFGIRDIWVAEDASGQVVASIGLWDQSPFRRTVATKFTRGAKSFVRFLALLGLVWKLPPIPREGQALRYAFGRWPLARPENAAALGALTRFVLNRVHQERKQQFLSIGFHERDPLRHSLDGITKVEEHIEIYTHWIGDSESYKEGKHAPGAKRFVDLSLI